MTPASLEVLGTGLGRDFRPLQLHAKAPIIATEVDTGTELEQSGQEGRMQFLQVEGLLALF